MREEGEKTVSPDTSGDREILRGNSNKSNGDGSGVTPIGRACLLRLNKPIKKKLAESKRPLRILIRHPAGSENLSPGAENVSPGSAMKGKQRFKARVRRYKLLEEV